MATLAPMPPGHLLIGNFLTFRGDIHQNLLRLRNQYGDILRFRVGNKWIFSISEPDAIKHITVENHRNYRKGSSLKKAKPLLGEGLLTSSGELWWKQRRLIQPAFHKSHIASFVTIITQKVEAFIDRLEHFANTGQAVDMTQPIMRLTLEVAARILLGAELEPSAVEMIISTLPNLMREGVKQMHSLIDIPSAVPTPGNLKLQYHIRNFDRVLFEVISKRRQFPKQQNDLLGLLMAACDEDTGIGMSDQQLRDETMTLLLAGYETTAQLIGWTFYLLSKHPQIRQQLETSITQILQGNVPKAEELSKLTYLYQVLEESMRMYPPSWVFRRQAIEADETCGYQIPAGADIFMCPYVVHHRADLWPNPEGFDPDRFTHEQIKKKHKYAYVPFGGGPRLCIGKDLAITEALVALALVMQKYHLDLVPGHNVESEASFTLRMKYGLLMHVKRREMH